MKKLWIIGLLLTLVGLSHADERKTFWCEQGNSKVVTQGLNSTTKVQGSSPSCLVTVFLTGTTTKAVIYSDNSRSVLSNPFHAQTDGEFGFYALDGRYDVTICANNTGNPNTCGADTILPTPITFSDILFCDPATGCGGGVGAPHNFLSATHLDTVPYTPPVAGDTVYSLPTPGKWQRLAGNATTTPMWMKSVGDGTVVTAQGWSVVGGACTAGQVITTLNPDLTVVCTTPTFNPLVSVQHGGLSVGSQPILNFIDGGNLTWNITNDIANTRINITQTVAGGGTGCTVPGVAGSVLFDDGAGNCTGVDKFVTNTSGAATLQKGGTLLVQSPDDKDPVGNYVNIAPTDSGFPVFITSKYSTGQQINVHDNDSVGNGSLGLQVLVDGHGDGAEIAGNFVASSQGAGTQQIRTLEITAVANSTIFSETAGQFTISNGSNATDSAATIISNGALSEGQISGTANQYGLAVVSGLSFFQDIKLQPEASPTIVGNSGPVMAQVTCDSTQRGRIHYVNSASGTADIPEICAKDSADVYSWKPMFGQAAIAGVNEMAFSATPTFNYALGPVKAMLLTGNVTSSTATNAVDGGWLTVVLCQDGTGNRTVTWPTNFYNFPTVNASANACTTTYAVYRASTTTWYATSSTTGGGGGSGLVWTGTWSAATNYVINNAVLYNGSSYVALLANTGVTPGSDGTKWQLIAQAGTNGVNGTNGTNGANGAPGAPGYSPNQIVSGCGVSYSGTGFTFTVSACTYLVNNIQYSAPQTTVTGGAADPSLDRTDSIVANACSPLPCTGTVTIVPGTASATPAPPDIDISTQTQLTWYDIPAASTAPSNVVVTDIYHDDSLNWACASTSNVNCTSTNFPHTGTQDIEWTSPAAGNNARLTIPSGTFDPGTRDVTNFWVRSKMALPSTKSITIQWYNSNNPRCTPVTLKDGNFGFNSANTTSYQLISVPNSTFACGGIPVTQLRFTLAGTGTWTGMYLDDIVEQGGLIPSSGSSSMVWKGAWSSSTAYAVNDTVTYQNLTYTAIQANTNLAPVSNPTAWTVHSFSVAGVAGNIQISAGTNVLGAINTSVSGSDVTFPGIVLASEFQSTDTVNNTQIIGKTGSGGDTTCPTADATGAALCIVAGVWQQALAGTSTYYPLATTSGTLTNGDCVSIDINGNLVDNGAPCGGGGGGGTVTSMSSGNLSPLFTTTVNTPTSTPALSFSLSTAAAHKFLGNATGSTAAPSYSSIGTGDLPFTYSGNTTELATATGTLTSGHIATFDASGNIMDGGSPISGGTVTSIATSSPISGGTITTTGTISCPTCTTNASALTSGQLMTGAGSNASQVGNLTGDVTTSGSTATTIANNAVTASKSAVVMQRRTCMLQVGDGTNAVVSADYAPFKVSSCKIPYAATIVEIDIQTDTGIPTIMLERRRGAATLVDLLSGALAANGTTWTCALSGLSGTCIDGTTSSNTVTLSNTSLNAGDVIEVKSGTASTETSTRIAVVFTVN